MLTICLKCVAGGFLVFIVGAFCSFSVLFLFVCLFSVWLFNLCDFLQCPEEIEAYNCFLNICENIHISKQFSSSSPSQSLFGAASRETPQSRHGDAAGQGQPRTSPAEGSAALPCGAGGTLRGGERHMVKEDGLSLSAVSLFCREMKVSE